MIEAQLHHIEFVVKDIDSSVKFFERLGLTVYKDGNEKGKHISSLLKIKNVSVRNVQLTLGNGELFILKQYQTPKPYSGEIPINTLTTSHIALTVPDIQEAYDFMFQYGTVVSDPLLSPDGKTTSFYGKDPNDIIIELIQHMEVKSKKDGNIKIKEFSDNVPNWWWRCFTCRQFFYQEDSVHLIKGQLHCPNNKWLFWSCNDLLRGARSSDWKKEEI